MSYHRYYKPYDKNHPVKRKPPLALGGVFDTLVDLVTGSPTGAMWNALKGSASVDQAKCLAQANASPQAKKIDAATANLAKNWRPATDHFAVADVNNMAAWIGSQNILAQQALITAPHSSSDAQTVINLAYNALARNNERVKAWSAAVQAAKAQGASTITSATFKTDVTNALVNISQAYVTRAVLDCNLTWLDTAGTAIEDGAARAAAILGVVLELAEKTVKVAAAGMDLVAWLLKYGPWAAVGLGGLYLWSKGKRAS